MTQDEIENIHSMISIKYIEFLFKNFLGFPGFAVVKNPPANAGTWVQALVWEDFTCCGATKLMHCNY